MLCCWVGCHGRGREDKAGNLVVDANRAVRWQEFAGCCLVFSRLRSRLDLNCACVRTLIAWVVLFIFFAGERNRSDQDGTSEKLVFGR